MIRIQVIPLKKVINRVETIVLRIIMILMALLFGFFMVEKKEAFMEKLFTFLEYREDDICDSLILRIVSHRLPIQFEKQVNVGVFPVTPPQEETKENESKMIEDEVLPNPKMMEWKRPEAYLVKVLENGKTQVGLATIKNASNLLLDVETLKMPSKSIIHTGSRFLIFHTHTSESYEIPEYLYSDYYRTQNFEYNMVAVGNTLEEELKKYNFSVKHDCTIHDYPNYNGSYKASYETVSKILENEPFEFVFDLHRDAISSNPHYRLCTTISGENVARLMFVVGSNGSGLVHEQWMENLKLAIDIQNKAEEMYPGLFREITLSNSRYNQQLSTGALIIEVGGTGNTLDEAKNAMKYLAIVLNTMKQDIEIQKKL